MIAKRARKEIVDLGNGIELEVYQLPNSDYQLSRTQVGLAIDNIRPAKSFGEFLAGKSVEALPYKDYQFGEIITEGVGAPIKGTTFDVAIAYWAYHAKKGDTKALSLISALAKESLERRADKAFGVNKSEQQYQLGTAKAYQQFELVFNCMQRLERKIDSMESELKLLRPAYEKLEKIESTLEEYPNLKEALDYLVANAGKTKSTFSLSEWLKSNNLSYLPSNVRMSIGRLVSSWCKLIEFKAPKGKYSDAFDPVLRFAVNYKLTQESK
jgi:hypothetical protein